jgi:cell fate regulator YaaT (PSP1 superfamily)
VLTNIIGIKFKKEGRIYNFNAVDLILHKGDQVLVNTDNGVAMGTVVTDVLRCQPSEVPPNLKSVVRKVTADDLRVRQELEMLEEEARKYCMEKIAEKAWL